ncbi:MAG TPA: ArgE/DapE family deacylase [Acidobacteriota bacterium]|jgi:acetylornithine deacetylase|nr:ArgE/DapE family deacylase [Acidobacteriota bacterium]
MKLPIDRDYLIETLRDLIGIDSRNPSLVSGGPGEAEIAAYVADRLRNINLQVEIFEPESRRTSVVGILKGTGSGRTLIFNAHLDTVGVEGMRDPFSALVRDGRVYGRGAYDMKGSVAACMAAAKALADAGIDLKGDLMVATVADEEYASLGTAMLLKRYPGKIDAAIVTEPTELEICVAHKGFIWLEVETIGKAAHGSRCDEGVDANIHMGRFLAELDKLACRLRSRKGHPRVGSPSLHAAMLSGGTGLSTYAANCKLHIERRTIPGETETSVMAEIEEILRGLAAADPTFQATAKAFFVRDAFEVSPDATIVKMVRRAATEILGAEPNLAGRPFWMDSALLSGGGVGTVIIGPKGGGAHSDEEWVDVDSLVSLAQILAAAAVKFE